MCPLRVILLLLSATLAGYFAFKSVSTQREPSVLSLSGEEEPEQIVEGQTGLLTKVSSGFWVMIDMLSGRYLYHNLKSGPRAPVKVATS